MCLVDDGCQVGVNKGFVDRGVDVCEYEYIILCLYYGEMQVGVQVVNCFNCQIGWIVYCQQLVLFVMFNFFNGFDVIVCFLLF